MAAAAVVAMDVLQCGLAAPRHLSPSPIEPSSAWPTTEAQFSACLDDAEAEFKDWKSKLPIVLKDLRNVFDDPANDFENAIHFLDTVIEALSVKIESEEATIRKDRRTRKKIITSSEGPPNEDWLLKFHDQFTRLVTQWHNERVAFYYSLIALRADRHPDAQGGPTFGLADDLERFLTTIQSI